MIQDLKMLEKHFDDRYDHRYVAIADCTEKQNKIDGKLSNDDKRIEIIAHDFDLIKKLMWVIATASISSVVAAVVDMLLK